MKVEFSTRAVNDLRKISAHSRQEFGASVVAALELRFRNAIEQISADPESGPRVEQRPGMRVLPLVRYPFKVFYRIAGDTVRILHIRHTPGGHGPTTRPADRRRSSHPALNLSGYCA